MESGKLWYKSKTVWFNLAVLALAAAGYALDNGLIDDPKVVEILAVLVPVGNLVLRKYFTSTKIGGTKKHAKKKLV